MALFYTSASLEAIAQDGTTLRNIGSSPFGGAVGFAFGERLRLTLTITSTLALAAGDVFISNIALYNDQPYYMAPQNGDGWRIQVYGSTGALTTFTSFTSDIAERNGSVTATIDATDTIITLVYDFYAIADYSDWIGGTQGQGIADTRAALQKDAASSILPFESQTNRSVYGKTKYIEISFALVDANLIPTIIPLDPSNGARTYIIKVKGKYFDRFYDNVQGYNPSNVLQYENLVDFDIQDAGSFITSRYSRIAAPSLFNTLDDNFTEISQGSSIMADGVQSIEFAINLPNAGAITAVTARLFVVKPDSMFLNADTFYSEALVDSIQLPSADATPAPNWLSSDYNIFGTPSAWSVSSSVLSVKFKIDGSKLTVGRSYRIIVVTSTADDYFSTHVSPAFTAIAPLGYLTAASSKFQTYNNEHICNDLTLSPLERCRCILEIDANDFSFGATRFNNGLLSASYECRHATALFSPALFSSGQYSVTTGVGSGLAPIVASQAGNIWTFYTDLRAIANVDLVVNLEFVITWQFNVDCNAGTGLPANVVGFTYEQRLRVRPMDTVRLTSLEFLNQATLLPVTAASRTQDLTVRFTKSGTPDMNLIALLFDRSNFNLTRPNSGRTYENESYASAYLPTLSNAFASGVEITFGDNIALYTLRMSQLSAYLANQWFLFAGALCYEPPAGLFNPSDLGTDLLLWLDADNLASAVIWIDNTENVNLTNGATSFTFVPSVSRAYVSGMQLSFDAGITHYTITSVVGSTVNLSAPIAETTGTYDVYVASVRNWADSSSYARTVQSPLALTPYYRTGQLAGSDSAFMLAPHYWNINPITASDPQNLQIVGLARVDTSRAGTISILFAHRSTTNALIQVYESPGIGVQIRSTAGGSVASVSSFSNIASPPNFNLSSMNFEQNSVGTQDLIESWNNGYEGARATALTAAGTSPYTSTLQTVGNYYNGTSYFAAFAGDFLQYFICENLALADIQKLEGWLAWKYGIQAQLPASHPYKTSQP